jgi:hypothetical protein
MSSESDFDESTDSDSMYDSDGALGVIQRGRFRDPESDEYDGEEYEEDWDSSDSEELGFLVGTHDHVHRHGRDPATYYAPPVRVRDQHVPLKPRPGEMGIEDHTTLPRQPSESSLAYHVRRSMWKEVRADLGARAMAAGAAGVRLSSDAVSDRATEAVSDRATDAKRSSAAKGKRTAARGKRVANATGASQKTPRASEVSENPSGAENVPDAFDLINALLLRAPADVLLALLAVAHESVIKHRVQKERGVRMSAEPESEPVGSYEGSSLLHFAVFSLHATVPKPQHTPTPLAVIKRLLELDPEAIFAVNVDGYTPMYVLARFGPASEASDRVMGQTVDALVGVSEKVVGGDATSEKLRDARGGAAILVEKDMTRKDLVSTEEMIIRAYPLHSACARHHGRVLKALAKAFPKAAEFRVDVPASSSFPLRHRSQNSHGAGYPLHMLLMHSVSRLPDLATFKVLLEMYPAAAKEPWRSRESPRHALHYLCADEASPLPLIKHLLRVVPETVEIVERGETPLHCALDHEGLEDANPDPDRPRQPDVETRRVRAREIVACVLRARPRACAVADRRGTYPLHLAIRNKWPPEIVRDILRAFPDAGMKKDRDGMYPLHAATRDGNVPSVKAIVEVTPHLARVSTEEDGLPLHVAARHSAPCEVTRHLLETYPEAARTPDSEGELPLHAVCAALGSDELMDETSEAESENDRRDYENAKVLYAAFPEGAFYTDARGKIPAERLPMYDVHRMLSRDVFGGDAWRGEGWRIMGASEGAAGGGGGGAGAPSPHVSGAALVVRVASNELAVAGMSSGEIERLSVALERARAAVTKETLRRPFEETLLAEHDRDEKWMCPIGYGLFRDPVKAGDGHVYERSNIVKWQEKSSAADRDDRGGGYGRLVPNKRAWKSPMTGLKCSDFDLTPATAIRKQIDEKLEEMMARALREDAAAARATTEKNEQPRSRKAKTKTKPKVAFPVSGPSAVPDADAAGGSARGAKRAARGQPAGRSARARR